MAKTAPMAEPKEARPTLPGLYVRGPETGITPVEIAAAVFSVLWVVVAAWYFLAGGGAVAAGDQRFLMVLMVIVLPVAMIWIAAMAMRAAIVMREESARLQAAIDALRQAYVAQAQAGRGDPPHPAILKRLDEIGAAQRNLEAPWR